MGAMQRRKGAGYELEVARELSVEFGVPVKRMLGQARDGGCDLSRLGRFVMECKRRAAIAVYEWLEQVIAAATEPGDIPIVIARADGKDSIVIMKLADFIPLMRGELIGQSEP